MPVSRARVFLSTVMGSGSWPSPKGYRMARNILFDPGHCGRRLAAPANGQTANAPLRAAHGELAGIPRRQQETRIQWNHRDVGGRRWVGGRATVGGMDAPDKPAGTYSRRVARTPARL